jgi:putative ABC transport system substrate-binding protein
VSATTGRRTVTRALGLGLVLGPLAARGQSRGQPARIGRLSPSSPAADGPLLSAFRKGMVDLGWIEGQTFVIESRFAEGRSERLPGLAAELVRQGVDVILAGSNPGGQAARSVTSRIPIVLVTTADPVGDQLVASLARPGGNVTGVTALGHELNAKRLALLKEVVPGATRIALLVNPASPHTSRTFLAERGQVARALGLELLVQEVGRPDDLTAAFAAITSGRAEALMVITDIMLITHRRRVVELAARHRLPAVYFDREFVEAGGLMFYGAGLAGMYHRAAVYVDRVLKGARPADLPVEQPTTFELVINGRTARALGLTIPPVVLARADQVIE